MKKIISVISLSFLVLLLLVSNVIGSSDWVEYRTDENGSVWLYKKGNIEKKGGNYIVQVWDKLVYSDKGREKYIQKNTEKGLSNEGFDKLSNIKGLKEMDCNKRRYRLLSTTWYDTDDKVLYSDSIEGDWDYIVSDSYGDILFKKVCK